MNYILYDIFKIETEITKINPMFKHSMMWNGIKNNIKNNSYTKIDGIKKFTYDKYVINKILNGLSNNKNLVLLEKINSSRNNLLEYYNGLNITFLLSEEV